MMIDKDDKKGDMPREAHPPCFYGMMIGLFHNQFLTTLNVDAGGEGADVVAQILAVEGVDATDK